MCLIAFAIQASARWPLVIAANRDESFDRPAVPLSSWQTPSGQTIVSGRDLRGGGTWMGITPQGRVAMLTNVRQADNRTGAQSRGELVTRWLDSDADVARFRETIDPAAYGGFNLVVGDVAHARWDWLGNRSFDADGLAVPDGHLHHRSLAPGVYGLSNADLDTPWPKTVALTGVLREALEATDFGMLTQPLLAALQNRARVAPGQLPRTGVSLSMEEILSSAYVSDTARAYGTRCSTVLVASAEAAGPALDVRIEELSYPPYGMSLVPGDILPAKRVTAATRWARPA